MKLKNSLDLFNPIVFLSYAKEDSLEVKRIFNKLEKDGFYPWLDVNHISPGSDWRNVIKKTIRSCRFFIVFLSKTSINKKGYIQKEIKEALDIVEEYPEDDVFIIPAKLDSCLVPDRLSKWQWVNLYEKGGYNKLKNILSLKFGRDKSKSIKGTIKLKDEVPIFKKPDDYVLYHNFKINNAFHYGSLEPKKYGISNGHFLFIRKDFPKQFMKLKSQISTFSKLDKSIFQALIPQKKFYRNSNQIVRDIRICYFNDRNIMRLTSADGNIHFYINPYYWSLIHQLCHMPTIYLISGQAPLVVEENNTLTMLIMGMNLDEKEKMLFMK